MAVQVDPRDIEIVMLKRIIRQLLEFDAIRFANDKGTNPISGPWWQSNELRRTLLEAEAAVAE